MKKKPLLERKILAMMVKKGCWGDKENYIAIDINDMEKALEEEGILELDEAGFKIWCEENKILEKLEAVK